jgi:hypothetical protein
MPEQEQSAGEIGPSEETTPDAETAPPLNREQRRAQAKGKKAGGAAFNPALPGGQNSRGAGLRGGTPGAASRFQRKTGSSGN